MSMTIYLPEDLEISIRSLVQDGRFPSEDAAVAEAVRTFLLEHVILPRDPALGSIGSMRDAADELDEVVERAMKNRREQPWRIGTSG